MQPKGATKEQNQGAEIKECNQVAEIGSKTQGCNQKVEPVRATKEGNQGAETNECNQEHDHGANPSNTTKRRNLGGQSRYKTKDGNKY